jgi:predicted CoA-substrate-specific enzyme activase
MTSLHMTRLHVGIDSGSTICKAVLFDGADILYAQAINTGWNPESSGSKALETLLAANGLIRDSVCVSVTGYGREALAFADHSLTEISSHGLGGAYLVPEAGAVIDIGGQDSKVIRIEDGRVTDFIMNDKCAAGTGRFLNMACETLGTQVDAVDAFVDSSEPIAINSMCTVFAESEIIGLLAMQKDRRRIMAGVLQSIALKVQQLATKLDLAAGRPLLLAGGLSGIVALRDSISKTLGLELVGHRYALYAGAVGACIDAIRRNKGQQHV